MSRYKFGRSNWRPGFDNYDEGSERPEGWEKTGFGHWGHGPREGFGGPRGGFSGWGQPGFGMWSFGPREGFGGRRQGFGPGFWFSFGPQQHQRHGHRHHGHGPHAHHGHHGHGEGRMDWRNWKQGWNSEENLEYMIAYLERAQTWLSKRQDWLKKTLEELRAEQARQKESRSGESARPASRGFSSEDPDIL